MQTPEIPLNSLHPGRAGALKGGKCQLCQLPLKTRESIDERMRRGDPVAEIRRWAVKFFKDRALGGAAIDAWYRHKRRHVLTLDRAVSKLSDGQREQHKRVKLARAILADAIDPQSYFAPAQLAQDIAKTESRLNTAADDALESKQHSALASLSSTLVRSYELRGKLGGAISDRTEVSLSVSLHELHARLDGILGADQVDRQQAARNLLGLAADPSMRRRIRDSDPTNPMGAALTIDAEPLPDSETPAENDPSRRNFDEPLGTRFR